MPNHNPKRFTPQMIRDAKDLVAKALELSANDLRLLYEAKTAAPELGLDTMCDIAKVHAELTHYTHYCEFLIAMIERCERETRLAFTRYELECMYVLSVRKINALLPLHKNLTDLIDPTLKRPADASLN